MRARLSPSPEVRALREPAIVFMHKAGDLPSVPPMMNFVMKVENVDEMNPLEEELAQEPQSLGIPCAPITSSNAVISLTSFLSRWERSLYL